MSIIVNKIVSKAPPRRRVIFKRFGFNMYVYIHIYIYIYIYIYIGFIYIRFTINSRIHVKQDIP